MKKKLITFLVVAFFSAPILSYGYNTEILTELCEQHKSELVIFPNVDSTDTELAHKTTYDDLRGYNFALMSACRTFLPVTILHCPVEKPGGAPLPFTIVQKLFSNLKWLYFLEILCVGQQDITFGPALLTHIFLESDKNALVFEISRDLHSTIQDLAEKLKISDKLKVAYPQLPLPKSFRPETIENELIGQHAKLFRSMAETITAYIISTCGTDKEMALRYCEKATVKGYSEYVRNNEYFSIAPFVAF